MSLKSIGHAPVRQVFEPAFLSPLRSNQPFRTVFDRFQRDRVACLLVTHAATGKLQGVYSSRDVLRKLAERPIRGDADAQVHDYMRTHPDTLTLDHSFAEVGKLMETRGFRHVPFIQRADPPWDDTGIPVGLARLEIWMKCAYDAMDEAEREALAAVNQADVRTNPLVSAEESETVKAVVEKMLARKRSVGAVAVTREGVLVAMLSEQDLTLQVAPRMVVDGEDRWNDPIVRYASKEVFWLPESASVVEILELMMDRKIRHVPIAREGDKGLEVVKTVSMRRILPEILKLMDPTPEPSPA
ncbi:MAG: CBS domain-containing protein [Myxococcota bacterium]|nr:CBS domain-containing protein [Myxococcota bacterium]